MINSHFCWDLEDILDGKDIESLINEYLEITKELVEMHENNIFKGKETFSEFHNKQLECSKLENKLFNYLNGKNNENIKNTFWFEKLQLVKAESSHYQKSFSNLNEKIYEHKELIEEWLLDDELKKYKRHYELIFKNKKHDLPSEVKKFFSSYRPMCGSYEEIFSTIIDNELNVKPAKDKDKQLVEIYNYESYKKSQINPDRILRKNAYYNWWNAVNSMKDTFAKLLYYKILEQNIDAKNAGFEGFYEEKIFDDELTNGLIPFVYKKVSRFYPEYKKFIKYKKQKLKKFHNLKTIKPWDMNMPTSNIDNTHISIEDAQKITLESLSVLGEEYVKNLKIAFNERWIDWESRPGKVSGAYCISGTYGLNKKYILMNYDYRINGVYTLVHELGHAMHSIEYCKNQDWYAETSIFIAEIPSTLNELLLSFYLIDKYKNDPEKQAGIYYQLITNYFATTIGQTILSDWEYSANKLVNEGRVLDAETAKMIFKAKKEKYHGERIVKKLSKWKEISLISILTIPHFYSEEFYVYKYTIGQIISLIIATEIYKNRNPEYIKKYFEFLSVGCSLSNLEILKIMEIDLEKNDIWKKARNICKEWVNNWVELISN